MSAKLCPLLMQGALSVLANPSPVPFTTAIRMNAYVTGCIAAIVRDEARVSAVRETITDSRLVACIGSTCTAWTTSLRSGEIVRDGWGRCAHFGGDSYPDPAGGAK